MNEIPYPVDGLSHNDLGWKFFINVLNIYDAHQAWLSIVYCMKCLFVKNINILV